MDKIDNLSVDYIVEQGISGIWHYRKWNSGNAECWHGSVSTSSLGSGLPTQTSQGNLYQEIYAFGSGYKFPFTFTSVQFVLVKDANAQTHGISQNALYDMDKITALYVYRGTSGAYPMSIEAYVLGSWK